MIIIGLSAIIIGDYYTTFAKIHSMTFIWSGYFFEYLSIPIVLLAVGTFNLIIASDFGWLTKNSFGNKFIYVIQIFAGLSYGIYLIHSFVVSFLFDILGFNFDKLAMNVYLYNLLNFFLVLGISTIISYLIMKIPKLRLVIGGQN